MVRFEIVLLGKALSDPLHEPIVDMRDRIRVLVRLRIILQRLQRDCVQQLRRNHIAGERSSFRDALGVLISVERVIDRDELSVAEKGVREITLSLFERRDRRGHARRAARSRIFEGGKEERLVFPDRPAQHAAGLIAVVIRLRRTTAIRGPGVRIESGISQEVVAIAMKRVRAGLGHHVDDGSAGLRVLGPEEVRLHLEFLHRIHRRSPFQVGRPGVLLRGVDDGAVHQHVRGGIPRAVGHEVGVGRGDGAGRAIHARRQIQQTERVSADVWQRRHVPVVDHLPKRRDGDVQKRRLAPNFDRVGDSANLQ